MAETPTWRDAPDAAFRTFVALYPSAPQLERIESLIGRLASSVDGPDGERPVGRGSVRWVTTQQAHLTLAFLGDVPREVLPEVLARVEEVAAGTRPFELDYRGVGAFPGPARPRVLWAGVGAGRDEVTAVAAEVRRTLEPLGVGGDGAPFRPHLTLGRVRRRTGPGQRRALAERLASEGAALETDPALVRELAVVISRRYQEGARHTVVARPPLLASTSSGG